MRYFILNLFAIILIFTQSPVSAMLSEGDSENELKLMTGPAMIVDIKTLKKCITLHSHEECLSSMLEDGIPIVLAAGGPDGPDRDSNDDGPGGPYDPSTRIIIMDPESIWPFLDEGDPSGDDY